MPELPLFLDSDSKELSPLAYYVFLAVITYPDSEEKQEEVVASAFYSMITKLPDADEMIAQSAREAPWLVRAVHRAARPPEVIEDLSRDGALSWAAGEILLTMLGAAIHHADIDINVTKTIHTLSLYHHGGLTRGGGQVKATPSTLWKAWKRYRSVSHFYAVRQIIVDGDDPARDFARWSTENFLEYLAAGEVIRAEAVKRRLLRANTLWTVPKAIRLPSMTVTVGALKPDLLELLRQYRPEYSRDGQ